MALTYWDLHPDFKTSSMLFARTLEEHYAILKSYFSDTENILDVGCGDGSFQKYIPNSIGIDENTDMVSFDLTKFTTLHFSESIGYVPTETIDKLLSQPNIKKVVIKDFYSDQETVEYFSYRCTTVKHIVIPLLTKYNYTWEMEYFIPNRERGWEIQKKHNMPYTYNPNILNVMLVATKN